MGFIARDLTPEDLTDFVGDVEADCIPVLPQPDAARNANGTVALTREEVICTLEAWARELGGDFISGPWIQMLEITQYWIRDDRKSEEALEAEHAQVS